MPITGKLTSVTAYSNSIRDNILLASLFFEWVKKDKKGARESRAGSRILRFCCILEPQIRFRTSPNRNERYRALAVPCILDKIIDQNGPVGSLLRFRSSGEDALRTDTIVMSLFANLQYKFTLPWLRTGSGPSITSIQFRRVPQRDDIWCLVRERSGLLATLYYNTSLRYPTPVPDLSPMFCLGPSLW
jgi:hypothetical protein